MNRHVSQCHDRALCLGLAVLRNALLCGVENIVYLLLTVSARIVVAGDGEEEDPGHADARKNSPSAELGAAHHEASPWPAFKELAVRLKVPAGAAYGFHRAMAQSNGIWKPPDLLAATQCIGLARVVLPASAVPSIGDNVRVAGVRLQGVPLNEHVMQVAGTTLVLPVVDADEYAVTAEDSFVRELLDEEAGHLDATWQMATGIHNDSVCRAEAWVS